MTVLKWNPFFMPKWHDEKTLRTNREEMEGNGGILRKKNTWNRNETQYTHNREGAVSRFDQHSKWSKTTQNEEIMIFFSDWDALALRCYLNSSKNFTSNWPRKPSESTVNAWMRLSPYRASWVGFYFEGMTYKKKARKMKWITIFLSISSQFVCCSTQNCWRKKQIRSKTIRFFYPLAANEGKEKGKKIMTKMKWRRELNKTNCRKENEKKKTNCFGTCIDSEQRLTRIKTRAKDMKLTEEAQSTKQHQQH